MECTKLGREEANIPDDWKCPHCVSDLASANPRKCLVCDKSCLEPGAELDEDSLIFNCRRCKSVLHRACIDEALLPYLLTHWECQYCLKSLSFPSSLLVIEVFGYF